MSGGGSRSGQRADASSERGSPREPSTPRDGAVAATDTTRPPAKFPLRLGAVQSVPPGRPARLVAPGGDGFAAKPVPAAAARALLRPQDHLRHAHAGSTRAAVAASGIGLDSADVRRRMTARLRAAGISSDRVLDAMASVPRHLFVDAALAAQAYEDTSLPIGHGQTISKPSVVARMIEMLLGGATARCTRQLGRTLEIGTGCGYQALLLATLAKHVVSVERLKPLHDKARALLAGLRPPHLRLVHGDGMLGHPPNAPYDSIIAAAGGDSLPTPWLEQLAVGGRLVSPVRLADGQQVLIVVDRTDRGWERSVHEAVHFVPLKSGLVV